MKTIQNSLTKEELPQTIRFIAMSATIPNIEDIAEWIGSSQQPAKFFRYFWDI